MFLEFFFCVSLSGNMFLKRVVYGSRSERTLFGAQVFELGGPVVNGSLDAFVR